MNEKQKTKQLLKILIGAAWLDGVIYPEERNYLHRVAQEKALADDPELKPLLGELKSVKPAECYRWLEEYLGENHNEQDYQALLEAISALIYSDGEVQTQEAQLLVKLQSLEPTAATTKSVFDRLLKKIQKLYRSAISPQV